MLSGIKDVDRLRLEKVDDRYLLTMCNTSDYCNKITDDGFFHRRSLKNFPEEAANKPDYIRWKQFYATLVYINSEREKVCRNIQDLIERGKLGENWYYLSTFDLSNVKFNYFVDKFTAGYHKQTPDYFPTTYKRYIQKLDINQEFSPGEGIINAEIFAIKKMLNENSITNSKLSPDIVKFVNRQIYINLLPYNVKIKDICKN
jgi:hypothetical protein